MNRRTLTWLAIGSLVLGACSGSDNDDAATTEAPEAIDAPAPTDLPETTTDAPAATEAPPETEAPTTTQAPTTTEAPVGAPIEGVVWRSAVDESRVNTETAAPGFSEFGVTFSLDMVVTIPGNHPLCEDAAEDALDAPEGVISCLLVQWRFDNSADNTGTTYIRPDVVVSVDGGQYDPLSVNSPDARPGTIDNVGLAMFPNAGPGSTVYITGSAEPGGDFEIIEQPVVLPSEGYQPIDWFDD